MTERLIPLPVTTGTGKTALAQALIASAEDWMTVEEEQLDLYSRQKEAAEAEMAAVVAAMAADGATVAMWEIRLEAPC